MSDEELVAAIRELERRLRLTIDGEAEALEGWGRKSPSCRRLFLTLGSPAQHAELVLAPHGRDRLEATSLSQINPFKGARNRESYVAKPRGVDLLAACCRGRRK
jgi:hypothetical protein